MNRYERPDVYYEKDNSDIIYAGEQTPILATPVFIGKCKRGAIGKPIDVYNFPDFENKTSMGLTSSFLKDAYLPYTMYDFYQNGGKKAYIVRVVGKGATFAKVTIPADTGLTFKAKDVGAWANNIVKIVVTKSDEADTFNIKVLVNDEEEESFSDLVMEDTNRNYIYVLSKYSNYINAEENKSGTLATGEGLLTGGNDDLESVTSEDYIESFKILDAYEDFGLICVPEQTNIEVYKALQSYCAKRNNCIPIMDTPLGTTIDTLITMKKELQKLPGAMYHPWEKIIDPSSPTEQTKLIPPSGAVCGCIARTDLERGTHKAPAGIKCTLNKAIGTSTPLAINGKRDEVAFLIANNINPIIVKPKRGVVLWGSESLSGRPISTDRLDMDIQIKCYEDTEWSIFEPASLDLCEQVKTSLSETLKEFFRKGAFKGKDEKSSFYVKCDDELNPQTQLDNGLVVAEIGYADKKPNKFTVIKVKRIVGQQ